MYNNNSIVLKPSWLGIMDWRKGYYNNKSNNTSNNESNINKIINNKDKINSNNDYYIDNDNDNDIDSLNDIDKVDNNKKTINNVSLNNFPYYNENAEYIKTNAVFIKPQIQNFYAKEFELLNNLKTINKPIIKEVLCYDDDDDFSMYNLQRKKQKKPKFIISKIFEDIKDLKNNKSTINSNNNITNENNINHINKSEIYSESDISSDDDGYFETVTNKKKNKK